jgi:hypothetical protein
METNTQPARYLAPGGFTRRVFNPLVGWLTRRGISLKGSEVLEVRGRSSGEIRATPVNPLTLAGVTYLVAPRGETQWVRNIRSAGEAALVRGRSRRPIRVEELADDVKAPLIRAYLKEWAWEVGAFFPGLKSDSSDAEIAAVASGFPVFRVL